MNGGESRDLGWLEVVKGTHFSTHDLSFDATPRFGFR